MAEAEFISAVFLSFKAALISVSLDLPAAAALVYLLGRRNFRGKAVIEGILNLPLVLPPVITGYLLLIVLGKKGIIGSFLYNAFGIRIAFTFSAAVAASMIVSFPLMMRSIKTAVEMIEPGLERAAATLGAGSLSVFFRITLPLALPGVINAAMIGFARSLGEFGATVTFAGNISGETRTIPLAVYSLLQVPGHEKEAAVLVGISVIISMAAMLGSAFLTGKRSADGTEISA